MPLWKNLHATLNRKKARYRTAFKADGFTLQEQISLEGYIGEGEKSHYKYNILCGEGDFSQYIFLYFLAPEPYSDVFHQFLIKYF